MGSTYLPAYLPTFVVPSMNNGFKVQDYDALKISKYLPTLEIQTLDT
jgi:hypothetical protein